MSLPHVRRYCWCGEHHDTAAGLLANMPEAVAQALREDGSEEEDE